MAPRPDLSTATWRTSSYSNGGANNCLEVADGHLGVIPVRDSKNPGPTLLVPAPAWQTFVATIKD